MNDREYESMFRAEDSHWWYTGLHELILRTIKTEAGERGLHILDAGCGTGRLCQLMKSLGSVEGYDASPHAVDFCCMRGLEGIGLGDLNVLELGENRFDVITSIDVLYHRAIHDEGDVLARFYQALKPGGILIMNLVAFEFLRSTHDIAVHTRRRYRRKDLLRLLEQQNFRVEKATYRLGFLFLPIVLYRMVKRLLPTTQPEQVHSDVYLPAAALNAVLLQLVRAENHLITGGISLPVGTSIFVVARKVTSKT